MDQKNTSSALTSSPAWRALQDHATAMRQVHMRQLFEQDPTRFEQFSLSLNDVLIEYHPCHFFR